MPPLQAIIIFIFQIYTLNSLDGKLCNYLKSIGSKYSCAMLQIWVKIQDSKHDNDLDIFLPFCG
jgi:hypothetical protein